MYYNLSDNMNNLEANEVDYGSDDLVDNLSEKNQEEVLQDIMQQQAGNKPKQGIPVHSICSSLTKDQETHKLTSGSSKF